jgi:hypothetical protein
MVTKASHRAARKIIVQFYKTYFETDYMKRGMGMIDVREERPPQALLPLAAMITITGLAGLQ